MKPMHYRGAAGFTRCGRDWRDQPGDNLGATCKACLRATDTAKRLIHSLEREIARMNGEINWIRFQLGHDVASTSEAERGP